MFAAAIGFGHSVDPSWFTWPFRALVAILGIVLLTLYTAGRYVFPLRRSSTERTVIGLDLQHVDELQRLAQNMADVTQVKIFAAAMVDPVIVRQRVSEHYVPGQRALHQSVRVESRVPRSLFQLRSRENGGNGDKNLSKEFREERVLYLPVIVPAKGMLLDGFTIRGAGGEMISALSYSEYLLLVACTLRALLMQAYPNSQYSQIPERARRAERDALLAIMRRGPAQHPPSMQYITQLGGQKKPLQLMANLVTRLSTHYALVAAVHCDADQRVVVEYERDIIPTMKLATLQDGLGKWLKDRLRLLLGARPIDLTVSLDNASTCQSYHLTMESAEGLYLADQQVVVDLEDYLRNKPYVQKVPPYYRFRRRLGQSHAHFYARFFPEPKQNQPSPALRLTYFEVPPGSAFRAMVTSLASALLVWLVAVVISTSKNQAIGTDIPALLLAFPAVVAAWLGFESPSRRLLEATLAARLSLIITATTSIIACGLFMAYQTKIPHIQGEFPNKLTFLGITEISWAAITILALANASGIAYACLIRTWEFSYLSKRARNEQSAIENG